MIVRMDLVACDCRDSASPVGLDPPVPAGSEPLFPRWQNKQVQPFLEPDWVKHGDGRMMYERGWWAGLAGGGASRLGLAGQIG